MKLKRIAVKNIKKIENLDAELNGNVFAIAGDNEVGKSTLLQLILQAMTMNNKIPVPVTQGKTDGYALFEFEAPGGMPYQVKLEYKENGKEKLTLMAPGGIKTTKVTDLRNIFDYHDVSVEEFMLWSETKEGRKKQRNLLLSIFPEQIQKDFLAASEKEQAYYESRTSVNKEVELFSTQLKGYELVPDELAALEKKDAFEQRLKNLKKYKEESVERYAEIVILENSIETETKALEKKKEDFPEAKANLKKDIDDKNEELNELKLKVAKMEASINSLIEAYDKAEEIYNSEVDVALQSIKTKHEKLKTLNEDLIPKEKLDETETKLNANLEIIKSIETKNTMRLDVLKSLEEKKEKQKQVEKDLADIRAYKESLLLNVDMPIDGLSLDEDGLNYKGLPFDKNQLSTSQFMQVVLKIMVAINKKTPIIPVGRAESFGKKKLQELIELAEKENCQIFFEKVSDDPLTIEVFEEDEFKPVEQKMIQETETKKKPAELPADWREKIKKEPVVIDEDDDDLSFMSSSVDDDLTTEFDEV